MVLTQADQLQTKAPQSRKDNFIRQWLWDMDIHMEKHDMIPTLHNIQKSIPNRLQI